ncbi:MAG: Uncharacterized protein FD121_1353 [Gallionellaceae bacterium]|nr:MAG: Uncharacterized protein FD121_1353 [Gallionellaceae bacterium]
MDSTTIFVKTSKAMSELAHRTGALPQKLRPVLIVIDGKTELAELLRHYSAMPDFKEHLTWMLQNGFIQPLGVPLAAGKAGATIGVEMQQTLKSPAGPISTALIDLAHELLGAQADSVVKRLQDTEETREALTHTLERCHKLIRLSIDESKAEQFLSLGTKLLASTSLTFL